MASYNVLTVDLSTVQERRELSPANRPVDSIAVLSITGGGTPQVAIGDGPPIPVYQGFAADICPAELAGIWLVNPAAVVGSMVVLVSHGGLRSVGGV